MEPRSKTDYIVIHCAATKPSMDVGADTIRDWHVNGNGWSDIGYHYIVLGNGEVVSGRHVNKTGAHCKGHNKGSIGICVTGNTSVEPPNTQQLQSLWGKIKMLLEEYGLERSDVYGHQDCGTTECPGDYLYEFVKQFKAGLLA